MKLRSLFVFLGLWVCTIPAAPTLELQQGEKAPSRNESTPLLSSRSIAKRDLRYQCDYPHFSPLLSNSISDAALILQNMVDHLDVALSLYAEDASGELKPTKVTKAQRTFDEHNAFMTYKYFVTDLYKGPNDPGNLDGLIKLMNTRATAQTMAEQYNNFLAGNPVPWVLDQFPDAVIWCGEDSFMSATNSAGLTFMQDYNVGSNEFLNANGKTSYWVSQNSGVIPGQEAWVSKEYLCPLYEGDAQPRLGVPVRPDINAYTAPSQIQLLEEAIVFCPGSYDRWLNIEETRTQNGIHYRDLHVDIGSAPTNAQKAAIANLIKQPDFSETNPRSIMWLSDFVVETLIHETTHSEAFVGYGNRLIDVGCVYESYKESSSFPPCMVHIASGVQGLNAAGETQGHLDAEAFAKYAMAMWINAVSWFRKFNPSSREETMA